jgi:hypothetical protein
MNMKQMNDTPGEQGCQAAKEEEAATVTLRRFPTSFISADVNGLHGYYDSSLGEVFTLTWPEVWDMMDTHCPDFEDYVCTAGREQFGLMNDTEARRIR